MFNLIYKDKKDLVIKQYNEEEKYVNRVKEFVYNLPVKYESVIPLFEEIENDNKFNPGLTCLLYINILENDKLLDEYYKLGLKPEDKEDFVKTICKDICEHCSGLMGDAYYDELYNEELGFLKIYISMHALKEYNNSKKIFRLDSDIVENFYKHDRSYSMYNFVRILMSEFPILDKEKSHFFNKLINGLDLGIYEQLYLSKYFHEISENLKENALNKDILMSYIDFIKNVEQKTNLYYLHKIKDLNPITFNELVKKGNLTYNEISELLIFAYERSGTSRFKEITPKKVLETFNTAGIHENYKLCEKFMKGYTKDKDNKIFMYTDTFFDVSHLDILYKIKDRSKEEIALCVKILNAITENININRIVNFKAQIQIIENHCFFETREDRVFGIVWDEYTVPVEFNSYHYNTDDYVKFLTKAKNHNSVQNEPSKQNLNLGYYNITDFRQEYPWQLYQYITKISNFIINNNIIDNFEIFMELLDLNENDTETTLSSAITKMLMEENYLEVKKSFQYRKTL